MKNPYLSRLWSALAFLFVLSSQAIGATVPYKFNGMNVTREGGVTYLRGTSPSEVASAGVSVSNHVISAAGSANWYVGIGALVQNGGVVFNAAVPVAATAASVAVTAVRANPAGLITSAVASYLLGKGIEYVNGQFVKPAPAVGIGTCGGSGLPGNSGFVGGTNESAASCVSRLRTALQTVYPNDGPFNPVAGPSPNYVWSHNTCTSLGCGWNVGSWTQTGSTPGTPVPAVDSDWDAARTGYWSDQATLDLVKAGVPLPTDKAVFSPSSKDVPLADPYVDAVSGKRVQEVARITPQPSALDTATVQVLTQEVDANGQPVIDSGTGQPVSPSEPTDMCKLNPEASGCKPLDEVPDIDLPEDTITLSISPVSGFGPDSGTCPADRTLFTKGGSPVVWSWAQYCTFASGIRPLIVGFAWLAALMIVIGVARRNS